TSSRTSTCTTACSATAPAGGATTTRRPTPAARPRSWPRRSGAPARRGSTTCPSTPAAPPGPARRSPRWCRRYAVRARQPDATGTVRRGGVDIAWERVGDGDGDGAPALLLLGVDTIVESRMWKAQVPWFARRHTVVTFDPPGNGRSGRTTDPRAY